MAEINTQMLHLVYKEIKTFPKAWNQNTWAVDFDKLADLPGIKEFKRNRCGTAYCFAGHAALLAGYEIAWDDFGESSSVTDKNERGHARSISEVAAEVLGLEESQRLDLFAGGNSLENIRQYIIDYTGEDPDQ